MRRLILLAGAMMVALLLSAAPALAAGPTATTQPATNVTTTSATLNATVNAGGNVVISCQFEYGPTQSYGQTAPCSPTPSGSSDTNVSAQVSGLTPGTAYDYQVVLTTLSLNLTTTGGNQTFTTLNTSGAPTATTGQASQVFATTATLNGTVDPGSSAVSDCHFAYGTNPLALTSTAPCSSTPTGSGPQPVSASISGLSPSTQYYFALSATNSAGTSTGATQSFTTTASTPAPTATTGQATAVTGRSATLNATVNPQGVQVTSCVFNYGTSTSYGSSAPCSPTPSGSSNQTVSASVSGLSPNTQYHFDVVLTTAGGTATGQDATFTTPVMGTASTQPATSVTATGATLHGTVDPQGATVQDCAFYYGTGSGFQSSVPCSPTPTSNGGAQSETATLDGLKPNVSYHYVIVLTTGGGTVTGSPPASFTTQAEPTGSTGRPTRVTRSGATLHGTANPHGSPVIACVFEYAVTPFTYGSSNQFAREVPCSPKPSGSGNVAVRAVLRGLAARTTYYYRLMVETQGGLLLGATVRFTTHAKPHRKKHHKKPGARITLSQVAPKAGAARFYFGGTGTHASRFECALARGASRARYKRCRSGIVYLHLPSGHYLFLVRAGNRYGFGPAAGRRFTIHR